MLPAMDGHIVVDERGVARLAGSRSRVVDLVLDRRAYGWTPEQIREQYPHLSLAQIHAAFSYYYAHQAEFDTEIERRLREVDELRAQAGESPVAKRLRAEGKLP
jgi:uncharacterized protein (DUF433 family)